MKYTRYDYKRKKGDNFFIWIVFVIVLSIFIGMSVYNIFIGEKGNSSNSEDKTSAVNSTGSTDSNTNSTSINSTKEFGIIQCGVFTKRENADATAGTIPNEYQKIVVEDSGTFKVIAGIYEVENSNEISKKLNESSINNFRISCKIDEDTPVKKAESEIIDGFIKVINKLNEKDVKSINTTEFKNWVNTTTSTIEDKGEELQSLLDNISSLPDEVKKEEINNSVILLYNILIKYKEN